MSIKAEISRRNGAKSHGPVTPEGKAVSARNSLKHGLTSSRVVLPHESQGDYEALEAAFIQRFRPADAAEADLVREMVASRWRMRRIEEMEFALIQKAIRTNTEALRPDADPVEARALAYAEVPESKAFRMLARHQGQLRRAYEKAWRELELLQDHRRSEEEPEAQNEPGPKLTRHLVELLTAPPVIPHTFLPEMRTAATLQE